MKEVVIVQYRLTHYRLSFYDSLRCRLESEDVRLRLLYSDPDTGKHTGGLWHQLFDDLPWGEKIKTTQLPGGFRFQPILRNVRGADLVIVNHATKYLVNHVYFLLPLSNRPKLAYWGHGWDHQTEHPDNWSERLKTWTGKRADWYFAYTWKVREKLIELGYDGGRITDVQNAVAPPTAAASPNEIELLRRELALHPESVVALYCGKMYPKKQLGLLIDAARRVHERIPSFVLILAGAGEQEYVAAEAAREHAFIHFVGPIRGSRRAAFFALSRICVMPGVVGLGVVDAFHYNVPPVATNFPYHSPEFVYLCHEENGIVAENSPESFAEAIIKLSQDDILHKRLVDGTKKASASLTVDEMARRFTEGILAALAGEDTARATVLPD